MDILRTAEGALAIRTIAARALAAKGIAFARSASDAADQGQASAASVGVGQAWDRGEGRQGDGHEASFCAIGSRRLARQIRFKRVNRKI